MSSSVIKLAKAILGFSQPVMPKDLRAKVDAVSIAAAVSALSFLAYQTVPLYVSNNELEARVQQLNRDLDRVLSTGKPLEKKTEVEANESPAK